MKAIILSVRPEWVAKILKGEKTIEIRKSVPKGFKGWVYIYCTKDRKFWKNWFDIGMPNYDNFEKYGGKVVARFWLDETTTYTMGETNGLYSHDTDEYNVGYDELEKTGLDYWQLCDYGKGKPLYAWYIKRLEIFDTPKELGEFGLTKAPQSWCYVEKEVIENDN